MPDQCPSRSLRRPWVYVVLSMVVLAPCYWQSRLQAGDLSSHIYNAWLARLIESGRAEGLALAFQTTNVLFDLMLSAGFAWLGAEAAQRLPVSLSVLVFVWGAFALMCAVSRRRPWHLLPCVAMLAYGWVFHMGFFNFYLSLGLCFGALAAVWKPSRTRAFAGGAMLAAAYLAHAIPVVWSAGLIMYMAAARRVAPRRRLWLTAGSVACVAAMHIVLPAAFPARWEFRQFSVITGADQLWVFGLKYYLAVIGLLLVWGLLTLKLLDRHGPARTAFSIPFQWCVISAAMVVGVPGTILLPGFKHALVYLAERMSLAVGVCVCVVLARAVPGPAGRAAPAVLAAVFFAFLYVDERALNRFEDRMADVVAGLPAGSRVISTVNDRSSRADALAHVIDRVCIGRCFSYANYEPSTAQFRVRVAGASPLVVASHLDSFAMQTGTYVLKQSDLPVWKIDLDKSGKLTLLPLKAGAICGSTSLEVFPKLVLRRMPPAHFATGPLRYGGEA